MLAFNNSLVKFMNVFFIVQGYPNVPWFQVIQHMVFNIMFIRVRESIST